ncbi:hypothetical protein RGQ29_018364 [Quercus rubra]|uniref:Micro-fibrillar-associated protein 1 C-terminal domain-containing protein n=1 Tax=Quercus rubra TaxID=3512 RepID=A0AAN7FNU7_QUERU|nr:hypothetical protein RGQ29_018364 [Quercus rubra]
MQEKLDMEEDDADASEERRRRIREKLLQREQEEAAILGEEEEEVEEEEEEEEQEESEYETVSEEEHMGIAMVKPVFVPKSERDTIAERERLEAEERALEESKKKRLEERKVQTKQIVVEEIRKDEEIQRNLEMEADIADVDTDDEVNEAEEYEAWKVREIARIKRDRDDRESMLKEREEIERVRNMTKCCYHKNRNGGSCRNITTRVYSSSQMLTTLLQLLDQIIFTLGISLPQLEKIRWTRQYCPRSCRSSTLVVVEGQNGLILSMRIQLTGTTRGHTMILYAQNTTQKWLE